MRLSLLVFIFLMLCVLEDQCDADEFLSDLNKDIQEAVSTAWHNIKRSIKRPVKLKRMGRMARRTKKPRTRKPTTTTKTTKTAEPVLDMISTPRVSARRRIELPVISNPEWRSFAQWSSLQKPMFVLEKAKDFRKSPIIIAILPRDDNITTHSPITQQSEHPSKRMLLDKKNRTIPKHTMNKNLLYRKKFKE